MRRRRHGLAPRAAALVGTREVFFAIISTTVTLTSGNATVRADFVVAVVNLTVNSDGNGTTTPSGTVSVTPGVAQSISAAPGSGYQFLNWTVMAGTATIADPASALSRRTRVGT